MGPVAAVAAECRPGRAVTPLSPRVEHVRQDLLGVLYPAVELGRRALREHRIERVRRAHAGLVGEGRQVLRRGENDLGVVHKVHLRPQ